jgi:hypothetical protein
MSSDGPGVWRAYWQSTVVLQLPFEQAWPFEQQSVLSFVCTQPDAGLQLSAVHGLASLQFKAAPGTHVPLAHLSPFVQAF